MKRDMELVREVLIRVESGEIHLQNILEIKPYTEEQVQYHIKYLYKAGYIEGATKDSRGVKTLRHISVHDLTEKGHDFLSATRDKKIWNQIKSKVLDKSASYTMELVFKLAVAYASGALQLPG